jgi:peptide/nickel transport system substrate-binding protein
MKTTARKTPQFFLKIFTFFLALSLIAACAGAPPAEQEADASTDAPADTSAADTAPSPTLPAAVAVESAPDAPAIDLPSTFNEAPALAERVAAGSLPPVAERLPAEPMVVEVIDEIGEYGGEWRMGMVGSDDHVLILKTALYDGLVRWNRDWTGVVPNLAKSWEVNADGSQYTFFLREGVKWSDGAPFTSVDIMFWVEHVLPNEELTPSYPDWLMVGDEQAQISAPNDYTIVFAWSQPNGLFLQNIAHPRGLEITHYQAEYAKQWHIDFNPEVTSLAEAENLPSWVDLWEVRVEFATGGTNALNQNPELPTLMPWIFTNALGDSEIVRLERNPYYWKVDAEGNQLPYIDTLAYELVTDREVLRLKAVAGEWTFQDRRIGGIEERAVFIENQERGNFGFIDVIPSNMNSVIIAPNLVHKDPVKREIYNNKLFRQALSVAINRQELIDTLSFGLGRPFQAAPRPESEFYDEEMATQFTAYDPEQANAWLDEAGYTRGPDGFRVGPDGNPIIIAIETSQGGDDTLDTAELVMGYWEEIGIQSNFTPSERSLLLERVDSNEHDLVLWAGEGGLGADVILEARWYLPFNRWSFFAMPWHFWRNEPGNALAEEPPDEVKRQIELYDQIKMTADPEEQKALMRQVLQIAKEQFYVIGTTLPSEGYGLVNNNFRNVPDTLFSSFTWPQPGPAAPEQFFIKQS